MMDETFCLKVTMLWWIPTNLLSRLSLLSFNNP